MTTEQKEAIKYLEYLRDEYRKSAKERKEKGEFTGYGTFEDLDKLNALEIDLVLDLVQDLQRKNFDLNQKNEYFAWLNKDLKKELKKKDKIIDELAKAFKQDDVRSVKEIKQYFERKVENESND